MLLATTPVRIRLAPDLAGLRFADRRVTNARRRAMLTLFDFDRLRLVPCVQVDRRSVDRPCGRSPFLRSC